MQKHVKATTELFNELSVIGVPTEEEDKVVTLLASLPDSFNMLVTALEAKLMRKCQVWRLKPNG